MLCADTSFLFSLYGNDSHTEEALTLLEKTAQPLLLSDLNNYELGNAFRFAECRGLIIKGEAHKRRDALTLDYKAKRCMPSHISLAEIVQEAELLSREYTLQGGHRAFDILHVAHALLAKPKRFLSFDQNQLLLAKKVGLRC
ncbi:MAG TPA: PIN domain-containing protein [Chthoniobacter sp.]|nr:PIN domain-containing protein [Chthoniobacter sp.]